MKMQIFISDCVKLQHESHAAPHTTRLSSIIPTSVQCVCVGQMEKGKLNNCTSNRHIFGFYMAPIQFHLCLVNINS